MRNSDLSHHRASDCLTIPFSSFDVRCFVIISITFALFHTFKKTFELKSLGIVWVLSKLFY